MSDLRPVEFDHLGLFGPLLLTADARVEPLVEHQPLQGLPAAELADGLPLLLGGQFVGDVQTGHVEEVAHQGTLHAEIHRRRRVQRGTDVHLRRAGRGGADRAGTGEFSYMITLLFPRQPSHCSKKSESLGQYKFQLTQTF